MSSTEDQTAVIEFLGAPSSTTGPSRDSALWDQRQVDKECRPLAERGLNADVGLQGVQAVREVHHGRTDTTTKPGSGHSDENW
jgi:hypothetical protein